MVIYLPVLKRWLPNPPTPTPKSTSTPGKAALHISPLKNTGGSSTQLSAKKSANKKVFDRMEDSNSDVVELNDDNVKEDMFIEKLPLYTKKKSGGK